MPLRHAPMLRVPAGGWLGSEAKRTRMQPDCPGLFKGAVPLPLPVPCDVLHGALGFLAGWWPTPGGRRAAFGGYLVYQALEEGFAHDGWSFLKDMLVFVTGFLLGAACRPSTGTGRSPPP